jgi:hypothetical protein
MPGVTETTTRGREATASPQPLPPAPPAWLFLQDPTGCIDLTPTTSRTTTTRSPPSPTPTPRHTAKDKRGLRLY